MSNARQLAANLPREGGLSNRNLIINGAMQVWQRGNSGFGHNSFSADRWVEFTNTNDGLSVSKIDLPSSGEPGLPRQFTSMAKFALTAGSTGNLNDLRQKIEHPKGLAGQTLTLSYYIKASSSCTIQNRRVSFEQVTNAPTGVSLPDINITTSWQRIVDTFTLGSNGNAVYSGSSYLDVVLSLPFNTTVDVYITGVQLEVGDTATPFEHRSYGDELQRCMRYYEKLDDPMFRGVEISGTTARRMGCHFLVKKRATPTVSLNGTLRVYNGTGTTTVTQSNFQTTWANNSSFNFDSNKSGMAGNSVGNACVSYTQTSGTVECSLLIDAEL